MRQSIIVVAPVAPPVGGMATYTEDLLKSRVSDQFELIVVRSNQIRKDLHKGFLRDLVALVNAGILLAAFITNLVTRRARVVHIHTNSFTGFYEKAFLTMIARLVGRKVILHIHGGMFFTFYVDAPGVLRRCVRSTLRGCDRVVVLSSAFRNQMLELGIPDERVVVLPNAVSTSAGLDRSRAAREPEGRARCTVLFLNRVEPSKGVRDLVEAAREVCVAEDYVRFRIVGPTTRYRSWLEDAIRAAGIGRRVSIEDTVEGEEKERTFQASDIYVLPSHSEGLPIGLLEAMSHGMACVATHVGAIPEVIDDGHNGLLVPPRDSPALASALLRLVRDPALREQLGAAARATVNDRFTWDVHGARLVGLYGELCGGTGRQPGEST